MAVYRGNRVAYGNGGHWYVQIVITDAGSNTGTTTTVYYTYQIVFENSISDSSNTINWSDPWGSGSANNRSFQSAGTHTIAGTFSSGATIVYGGGNSLHFRMYATGMAGGGTGPSVVEFDYPLPGRTASPPDPPRGLGVSDLTATSARTLVTSAGAENGYTTTAVGYRLHRTRDGWHVGDKEGPYSGVTWTNLERANGYYFFARGYNAAGWGAWAGPHHFNTSTTVPGRPLPSWSLRDITQLSAYTTGLSVSDNGGLSIVNWGVEWNTSPLNIGKYYGTRTSGSGGIDPALVNLLPGTIYYARVRAANSLGWGPWSDWKTFATLPGVYVKVGLEWKNAIPYVNDNGLWKPAIRYINVGGEWRQ